ncbi:MAG: acyltransferase [Verrucomicrobiales bacterium]|nr:acyltransferase [Verrucomicrobiales bacterium]
MTDRIKVIDGLRGVAILGVIWHHLFSYIVQPGFVSVGPGSMPFLPLSFLSNGWLGVNLFFVLSGFVLFYPYVTGKRRFASLSDLRGYYIHRAKRLLPLYYFSVIYGLIFIYQPSSTEEWVRHGLLMLTATFNFTGDLWFPPYNWVMWSLGIEIWFSIFFPLFVMITRKISVPWFLVAAAIVSLAIRYVGIAEPFLMTGNRYLDVVKDSLPGRLDDFALGMFIAWFWLKSPRGQDSEWAKNSTFVSGMVMIFVACHLWDFFIMRLLPIYYTPLFNLVLLSGLFLIMQYFLNATGRLPRLMSHKSIGSIGLICYSLYLWHGVLMKQMLGTNRDFWMVTAYLIVLVPVSVLSYNYIERNQWFCRKPGVKSHCRKPAVTVKRESVKSRGIRD